MVTAAARTAHVTVAGSSELSTSGTVFCAKASVRVKVGKDSLGKEKGMSKLVRKNVLLDPQALKRAQRILRTRSESEAIRKAINLVAFRKTVIDGFDRVAGKAPDFPDVWEE